MYSQLPGVMYERVGTDDLDCLADADLICRFQRGHEDALEILLRRHSDDLYKFCRHLVTNTQDAEDIYQESMVRAIDRVESLKSGGAFRGWLFRIARNLSVDFFRSHRRTCQLPDEDNAPSPFHVDGPHNQVEVGEEHRTVAGALRRLALRHQKVLLLREVEGLTYSEIGTRLDISQSAVETLLFRARRRLREEYYKTEGSVSGFAILSLLRGVLSRPMGPASGSVAVGKAAVTAVVLGGTVLCAAHVVPSVQPTGGKKAIASLVRPTELVAEVISPTHVPLTPASTAQYRVAMMVTRVPAVGYDSPLLRSTRSTNSRPLGLAATHRVNKRPATGQAISVVTVTPLGQSVIASQVVTPQTSIEAKTLMTSIAVSTQVATAQAPMVSPDSMKSIVTAVPNLLTAVPNRARRALPFPPLLERRTSVVSRAAPPGGQVGTPSSPRRAPANASPPRPVVAPVRRVGTTLPVRRVETTLPVRKVRTPLPLRQARSTLTVRQVRTLVPIRRVTVPAPVPPITRPTAPRAANTAVPPSIPTVARSRPRGPSERR